MWVPVQSQERLLKISGGLRAESDEKGRKGSSEGTKDERKNGRMEDMHHRSE